MVKEDFHTPLLICFEIMTHYIIPGDHIIPGDQFKQCTCWVEDNRYCFEWHQQWHYHFQSI